LVEPLLSPIVSVAVVAEVRLPIVTTVVDGSFPPRAMLSTPERMNVLPV